MKRFTQDELRSQTNDITLRRGRALEDAGCVEDFEAFPARNNAGKLFLGMSAWVREERGDYHETSAYLTADEGALQYVECDCHAYTGFGGLCRHCAALLIHYLNDEDYYIHAASRGGITFPFSGPRRTDAGLLSMLDAFGRREQEEISSPAVPGVVKLEPTLQYGYSEITVSLRIGIRQMYVVKDIHTLVSDVREVREHKYGKNLSFLHRMEAFDEKSKPLMDFFMRMYEEGHPHYAAAERYAVLHHAQLDELLALTEDDGILIDMDGQGASLWKLTDEPLRRKVTVEQAQGGVVIRSDFVRRVYTVGYHYALQDQVIYRSKRAGRQEEEQIEAFLDRCSGDGSFVAEADLPVFVRGILPRLEQYYDVEKKNVSLARYLPAEASFDLYIDLPQENLITCDLVAVYGDQEKYHVLEGIAHSGKRNVPQELNAQKMVMQYCNAFDQTNHLAVLSDDEDAMYTFLTEGIAQFHQWADVYVSEKLKRISEVRPVTVSVGVSLSGDLLTLHVSSGEMPLDELAAVLSKYSRKKKFIRLKNGTFLSTEDPNLDTLSQVKKGLMLTDREFAQGQVSVPKFRALYLDAQLQQNDEMPVEKSRDFKTLIRQMHTVGENDYEIPQALDGILREYQKTGYRWIETLAANGFGGILADDMGLGKTLQVITFLYAHYEKQPENPLRTLIVCPASLVYNWEDECRRFAPSLPVYVMAGSGAERGKLLESLPSRAVIITSYDLLKRDIRNLEEISFAFQILDEAQFIKNASTKAARAVKMVRSGFRLALTGTPVENRLSELWSIFDYLMPGYLFSYEKFRSQIETPIVQNGDEEAMQRVQKMISPFVLRRLKRDVLKDLPDKIERDMAARMTEEQRKLYDAHVQRLALFMDKQAPEEFDKSRIQILAELTKLRQLCCDPALMYENYSGGSAKLDLCMELVSNAVEGGHKLLIFSQFTSMLERITQRLDDLGILYYKLTGETPKQERIRLVNAFNSDTVPVFCISLKAGGTGLNLTAADIVIHYDPWWNTAAQNQATDRTHRIGQKNVVTVYRLIARDTIEEKIVRLQERKQELADQVLSGSEAGTAAFSREELLALLT